MQKLILALVFMLAATSLTTAKDKPAVHDPAPLRYGIEQAEAENVISDAAMWKVPYRVDTATTLEFTAIWSGQVFYRLRFLNGKCCFIEKRAEVGPEEVDQLLQMYRGVYGDSPEATSSRDGRYIFSRWQAPEREITISAVGRGGKYKLFYEEFDPVSAGDVRVAQERELGEGGETDPLTGRLRFNPLGQSAEGLAEEEGSKEQSSESVVEDETTSPNGDEQDDSDTAADDGKGDEEKPQRPKRPKKDPVID
jgi:hypothetical protein